MNRPIEPDHRGLRGAPARAGVTRGGQAVVGFEGTAASRDALAYAVGWAGRVNGGVDVLYVWDEGWKWVAGGCATIGPFGDALDCATETSRLMAETVAGLLAGTGLNWTYHTAGGGVAHALERHAEAIGADAIIIGKTRRLHPRLTRSSVAHRLLGITDRIIIVVP